MVSLDAVGAWKTAVAADLSVAAREAGLDIAGLALVPQQLGDQGRVVAVDAIGGDDIDRDGRDSSARYVGDTEAGRGGGEGIGGTWCCCRRSS